MPMTATTHPRTHSHFAWNPMRKGMKEDLNMYANELVTATSVWTVG